MTTIQFDVDNEILTSFKGSPESLAKEVRMAAAAKLFELGELSSGRAAQLAGITRVEFLATIGRYQVSPFTTNPDELEREIKNA
jgi:predicted HTH domain antitoxin